MYCGHIGIGLGAKGLRPHVSLALLLIAAFGPDWFETALIALGVRNTPEWSHSIPAVAVLAALFVLFALSRRDTSRQDALLVGAVCQSHLLVDYLTGRKPLWFRGPRFGLGLYHYPLLDFVLEGAVIFVGWTLYRRSLPQIRQRNHPFVYGLLVALLAMQALFDWKFAKPS